MRRLVVFLLFAGLLSAVKTQAQHSFGIALYDVDALYDTIPSKFYDDRAYTPAGELRWDAERYARKIAHTAAVIDSMAMPLVALSGVESEQVVRDLVGACSADYGYLHRTSDFSRGMDFALLYYGEQFIPARVEEYGYALCVEGELKGRNIAIIIEKRSYDVEYIISQLHRRRGSCDVIVLGQRYEMLGKEWGLHDVTALPESQGLGTMVSRGRWIMSHRIATNIGSVGPCGVFIRRWMLDDRGEPLPTYRQRKYVGGYSSYLPVYVYFD